jgi:hypothetical protein
MSPRTGLDGVGTRNISPAPELELRPLGPTARIQSLYRLRYPGGESRYPLFHLLQ